MKRQGSLALCVTMALAFTASLSILAGAQERQRKGPPIGVAEPTVEPPGVPAHLGPMPRLDPITHFIAPIDPWEPDGPGWGVEAVDANGDPVCMTNLRPTTTCDPEGPRPFLHAGFDARPAADRGVHASAAGRVVVAGPTSGPVTGRSLGEGAGIVVLEHDLDGDPATVDDRLLTVYSHVEPLVAVGAIVAQGETIALTSTVLGDHLHFGVRRAAFDPADLDIYRTNLPPAGTSGCVGCYSRHLPVPPFPDLWEDPRQILAGSPFWLAIYGEPNDGAEDVLETDDGSVAFGYTLPQPGTPGRSMAVRRLDREGKFISQRAYYVSSRDAIKHVERTQDGGVIALAVSISATDGQVPMLVKFDAAGGPQWARQYQVDLIPGVPAPGLWWEDLAVTADGGVIVTGTIRQSPTVVPSIMVARLDAAGNVQWIRTYDPLFAQRGADGKRIAPTPDGGFVIAAEYQPIGPPQAIFATDLLAFRIDAAGEVLWGTMVGNGLNDARVGRIAATPDGGSIVVGYRTLGSYFLPIAIWVVKLNGDGTIAWNSVYGSASGNGELEESGTGLVVTADGGYVIAGHRSQHLPNPYEPVTDLLLMRLDGAGEIVGQRRLASLGVFTTPLGLRAAADGFLLAGGADSDCRLCIFPPPDGAARFVVAHVDGQLDCQGQCSVPYDLVRQPRPPGGVPVGFRVGAVTATPVDREVAQVDTTGRRHLCDHDFFGSPPVFESASIDAGPRIASCDRTAYAEAFVCWAADVPGIQATSPVILDVTYDSLLLTAHVVDGDSTPEQNDVVSVTATLAAIQPPDFQIAFPMLDDGSTTILPGVFNNFSFCNEDPLAGVCQCGPLSAPAYSGDVVTGDGIYTFETSLTLPPFGSPPLDVGKGCVLENRPRSTLLSFSPGMSLSVILRATDRIGNVTETTATVTTTAATESCTGDACGCCLLVNPNPLQCSGLDGMQSPDFPAGICHAF